MRLTKRKAINIAIERWEWAAETGSNYKEDWPGGKAYPEFRRHCPLCEYDGRHKRDCKSCPYYQKYGFCAALGSPYSKWSKRRTKKARKLYAKQCLDQLRQL